MMVILVKCTDKDRIRLNNFLNEDTLYNTFIRSDIEFYGFDNVFQTLYMSLDHENKCQFVYLIFHNIMIIAGHVEPLKTKELLSLVDDRIDIIMGKASLVTKCQSVLSKDFDYSEKLFFTLADDCCLLKNELSATEAIVEHAVEIHYFLNTFSELNGMYTSLEMILNRISGHEGQHIFYEQNGQIIAHGNSAANTADACFIGGVATHQAYRHQGYAKRILSQLSIDAFKHDRTPCLLSNPYDGELFFEDLGYRLHGPWGTLKRK